MMSLAHRLLDTITRFPFLSVVVGLTVAVLIGWGATTTYAVYYQPDPQIVSQPMSWQPAPGPVANTGIDVKGRTLDEWIKQGGQPKDYRPVEKTTWRPGDSLYSLRYECFLYKTQDAMISRAFLGGDGSAGTNRTVYMLPDIQIPTRTDGCSVKNHRTPIPADLPLGTWTYQVTANFYKSPIQPSVRVLFKPVVIDVR